MSPWQQEMKREGMALLYPDRATVQYVLAEEAERRSCIRALLYLRDERSAPGQGWLEKAEELIEELPAVRFFEYWLALLRHQKAPWFEKLNSRLPSNGLADALRLLRSAMLTRTLQGPEQTFREGLQAAAAAHQGRPTRQFHAWGTILVGCYDLGWSRDIFWPRVLELAPKLSSHFREIYAYLAIRLGDRGPAEQLAGEHPELQAYLARGRAPASVGALLRNYRYPYQAECKLKFVADVLVEQPD